MAELIDRESYVWSDTGIKPQEGDEVYGGGLRPIAEYDNYFMWAITTDIKNLSQSIGSHSDQHEAGSGDPLNLDGLSVGYNPSKTLQKTSSPDSFIFSGSEEIDILTEVSVTVLNTATSERSEDVTVSLYRGGDTSGELIDFDIESITLGSNSSTTLSFFTSIDFEITDESHFIDVESNGPNIEPTQISIDTLGGEYTLYEDAGFRLEDQYGKTRFELAPIKNEWSSFPAFNTEIEARNGISVVGGSLDIGAGDLTTEDQTLWDSSEGQIPAESVEDVWLHNSGGRVDGDILMGGFIRTLQIGESNGPHRITFGRGPELPDNKGIDIVYRTGPNSLNLEIEETEEELLRADTESKTIDCSNSRAVQTPVYSSDPGQIGPGACYFVKN